AFTLCNIRFPPASVCHAQHHAIAARKKCTCTPEIFPGAPCYPIPVHVSACPGVPVTRVRTRPPPFFSNCLAIQGNSYANPTEQRQPHHRLSRAQAKRGTHPGTIIEASDQGSGAPGSPPA